MEIKEQDQKKIKIFFDACNELIRGKFILSDIKISRMLKTIATCQTLYSLFSNCLLNYNFDREFRNARISNKVNGGYFVMPTEERKIVALVFCLLLEVDKGSISLQSFVNENFYSSEGYNVSYSNFSINVLVPFKSAILKMLKIKEDGTTIPEEEKADQVSIEEIIEEKRIPIEADYDEKMLFVELRKSLNELYSIAKRSKRLNIENRDNLLTILDAIHEAINLENLQIVNALMISTKYYSEKDKGMLRYYREMIDILLKFYYN